MVLGLGSGWYFFFEGKYHWSGCFLGIIGGAWKDFWVFIGNFAHVGTSKLRKKKVLWLCARLHNFQRLEVLGLGSGLIGLLKEKLCWNHTEWCLGLGPGFVPLGASRDFWVFVRNSAHVGTRKLSKKTFSDCEQDHTIPSVRVCWGFRFRVDGSLSRKSCTEILVCVNLWQCLKRILHRVTDGNGGADFEGHRSGGRASSNRREKRALQKWSNASLSTFLCFSLDCPPPGAHNAQFYSTEMVITFRCG